MLDWLVSLVFGAVYPLFVMGMAALAAIPYSVWRAVVWLRGLTARRTDGDT